MQRLTVDGHGRRIVMEWIPWPCAACVAPHENVDRRLASSIRPKGLRQRAQSIGGLVANQTRQQRHGERQLVIGGAIDTIRFRLALTILPHGVKRKAKGVKRLFRLR